MDLPGTLALLARIGYREIEVAGLFGRAPEEIRRLLDANHLRAIGGHQLVGPALVPFFGARTVEDALDEAEALGQPYVGTAGITRARPTQQDRGRRYVLHGQVGVRSRPGSVGVLACPAQRL